MSNLKGIIVVVVVVVLLLLLFLIFLLLSSYILIFDVSDLCDFRLGFISSLPNLFRIKDFVVVKNLIYQSIKLTVHT
jgi:hypothetical protein